MPPLAPTTAVDKDDGVDRLDDRRVIICSAVLEGGSGGGGDASFFGGATVVVVAAATAGEMVSTFDGAYSTFEKDVGLPCCS